MLVRTRVVPKCAVCCTRAHAHVQGENAELLVRLERLEQQNAVQEAASKQLGAALDEALVRGRDRCVLCMQASDALRRGHWKEKSWGLGGGLGEVLCVTECMCVHA